jgi:multidrug efflux pump subunit AcrA (membrane-fusion protein)
VTGDGANAVTTRVYHLSFEAPGLQFKPGDQSRVTIVLSRRDDTLWLPSDAIRFDPDPYVLSQKSGSPERLRVTTGIRSADRVEILEGLDQGDVVLAWQ